MNNKSNLTQKNYTPKKYKICMCYKKKVGVSLILTTKWRYNPVKISHTENLLKNRRKLRILITMIR